MDFINRINKEQQELKNKFASTLQTNLKLTRQLVSFQANKTIPKYRWFKYKEGFSVPLVQYVMKELNINKGTVLDPFAGTGVAIFFPLKYGMKATGIELLHIGIEIMNTRKILINNNNEKIAKIVKKWINNRPWENKITPLTIPYLKITKGAYSKDTEKKLGKYLACVNKLKNNDIKHIFKFIALCILEEISYTRKDGQCLRWDYRSGRCPEKNKFNKGKIKSFSEAIISKLEEVHLDLLNDNDLFAISPKTNTSNNIIIIQGSVLEELPNLHDNQFDFIITSPPYCNRYDYTRTYALELSLLGVDEDSLKSLRQNMLSCTVENRDKDSLDQYSNLFEKAYNSFKGQKLLHSILEYLNHQKQEGLLNNNGIPRMIKNYFLEMSNVIFECHRVLKSGAPMVMVNDNVRYEGIHIPVDLILSGFAEDSGFIIEKIWVLPKGKGNSSQQMGRYGREEIRKCVYVWRKPSQRNKPRN